MPPVRHHRQRHHRYRDLDHDHPAARVRQHHRRLHPERQRLRAFDVGSGQRLRWLRRPLVASPARSARIRQNIQVTVNPGTITITTPYTSTNPFVLPAMTLSADGTYLQSSAPFPSTSSAGEPADRGDQLLGPGVGVDAVGRGDPAHQRRWGHDPGFGSRPDRAARSSTHRAAGGYAGHGDLHRHPGAQPEPGRWLRHRALA